MKGSDESQPMIGIDTNVLIRFLTQDDPTQSARANRVFLTELSDAQPGFISAIVVAEMIWVLRSAYHATPPEILEAVDALLNSSFIVLEQHESLASASSIAKLRRCTIDDAFIASISLNAGCDRVFSFDRGAVRAGMTLLF